MISCDVPISAVQAVQIHYVLQPVVEVLVVTQKTQTNPDGVLFASDEPRKPRKRKGEKDND